MKKLKLVRTLTESYYLQRFPLWNQSYDTSCCLMNLVHVFKEVVFGILRLKEKIHSRIIIMVVWEFAGKIKRTSTKTLVIFEDSFYYFSVLKNLQFE